MSKQTNIGQPKSSYLYVFLFGWKQTHLFVYSIYRTRSVFFCLHVNLSIHATFVEICMKFKMNFAINSLSCLKEISRVELHFRFIGCIRHTISTLKYEIHFACCFYYSGFCCKLARIRRYVYFRRISLKCRVFVDQLIWILILCSQNHQVVAYADPIALAAAEAEPDPNPIAHPEPEPEADPEPKPEPEPQPEPFFRRRPIGNVYDMTNKDLQKLSHFSTLQFSDSGCHSSATTAATM